MLLEAFIPYLFISVITSTYITPHHFGIFLMYLMYVVWTASDKKHIEAAEFTDLLKKAGATPRILKKLAPGAALVFAIINLYWSGYSYYIDMTRHYYSGRALSQWVKEENITDKKILAAWSGDDTHLTIASAVAANPYFDKAFYYGPYNKYTFLTHIIPTKEQAQQELKMLEEKGDPDFRVEFYSY